MFVARLLLLFFVFRNPKGDRLVGPLTLSMLYKNELKPRGYI